MPSNALKMANGLPEIISYTLKQNEETGGCMNQLESVPTPSHRESVALLNATELSIISGISRRAIINASVRGSAYFRAWSRSETGAWDFEVLNPGSRKPRKGFYRVE